MSELPISDYMKKYFKENGVVFTDFERAAIIWNSPLPIGERLERIRIIADNTEDKMLAQQITERIDHEANTEKIFRSNDDMKCVYILVPDNDEEDTNCFAEIENAVKQGCKCSDKNFKIVKRLLFDKVEDSDEDYTYHTVGEGDFTKDGVMTGYWSSETNDEMTDNGRFENAYIFVKNPFDRGDIVRYEGSSNIGIVETSQAEWFAGEERKKNGQIKFADYSDISVRVDYLADDGTMGHSHPDLLYLEKVTQLDDELKWELLNAASELLKGEGDLETYSYLCKEYRVAHSELK